MRERINTMITNLQTRVDELNNVRRPHEATVAARNCMTETINGLRDISETLDDVAANLGLDVPEGN